MIIGTITSGLGNQLFQYALARQLSLIHHTTLYFDTRFYQTAYSRETNRSFKLDKFHIPYKRLTETGGYLLKATRLFPGRNLPPLVRYINEKHYHFDPSVLQQKAAALVLKGYWHSAKYFAGAEKIIRNELTFAHQHGAGSSHYIDLIRKAENPVSVHIRRGDYVHHPVFSQTFGFIGDAYYHKATELISSRQNRPVYFIFTDDKEWAEAHFPPGAATVFVKNTGDDADLDDLHLMSLCNHHIIANSSYSWWGAWLGRNPGKIVIAPQKWFRNQPDWDTKDLLPDSWLQL